LIHTSKKKILNLPIIKIRLLDQIYMISVTCSKYLYLKFLRKFIDKFLFD